MRRTTIVLAMLPMLALLYAPLCAAHGLTMTTASITIRNSTHLSLRLNYDPLKLLANIWQGKRDVPNLAELASMKDDAFGAVYETLKSHLRDNIKMSFGGEAVESFRVRFQPMALFRKQVRGKFMAEIIHRQRQRQPSKGHSHADGGDGKTGNSEEGNLGGKGDGKGRDEEHGAHSTEREFYQYADADGFVPKGAKAGTLGVDFPPELGQILVTYSQPKSQTLSPGKGGTRYRQRVVVE